MTNTAICSERAILGELESRLLSGKIKPGEYLPSERILAQELGVSRPIVHNALIRMEEKGFVKIISRQGALVLDYKTHGNLCAINSLVNSLGRDLDHSVRMGILSLLKGTTDLIIADILDSDYDARLEIVKTSLYEAMHATEKQDMIMHFTDVYLNFSGAAVNPFYTMIFNSMKLAIQEIGITLIEQDSSFHALLRLWSSLMHQLKNKNTQQAYSVNQTIFDLILNVWR